MVTHLSLRAVFDTGPHRVTRHDDGADTPPAASERAGPSIVPGAINNLRGPLDIVLGVIAVIVVVGFLPPQASDRFAALAPARVSLRAPLVSAICGQLARDRL